MSKAASAVQNIEGSKPSLYTIFLDDAQSGSAAAASVEEKDGASAENIATLAGFSLKPLNISAEAMESIQAETSQYSITPTSFASRAFLEDGIKDRWFIDQYKCGDNAVLRFGINHVNIKRDDIRAEELEAVDVQATANLSSPSPVLQSPSPSSASASASPARSQASSSNRSKGKYSDAAAQAVKHHSLEKEILKQAIDHLLTNDEDNRTALVDVFARSIPDGVIKFLENGQPEVHTILLYKNPPAQGKHEVLVIDPSNFSYTVHMANADVKPAHPLLEKITVMNSSDQIYKPEGSIGPNSYQYRDCIDIAVKLAFGFNRLKSEEQSVDLKVITQHNIAKSLSNIKKIDDAFFTKSKWLRIKQASDVDVVKKFYIIEQQIDKALTTIEAFSKPMNQISTAAYQQILDADTPYKSSLRLLVEYHGKTINALHDELLSQHQNLIDLIGHSKD